MPSFCYQTGLFTTGAVIGTETFYYYYIITHLFISSTALILVVFLYVCSKNWCHIKEQYNRTTSVLLLLSQ